jgi:hypothetical protein
MLIMVVAAATKTGYPQSGPAADIGRLVNCIVETQCSVPISERAVQGIAVTMNCGVIAR